MMSLPAFALLWLFAAAAAAEPPSACTTSEMTSYTIRDEPHPKVMLNGTTHTADEDNGVYVDNISC